MRRNLQLTVTLIAIGAVSACSGPDTVLDSPSIPTAGVRFINAVPDTNQMDFRFVDFPENNVQFRIVYRNNLVVTGAGAAAVPASTQIVYKPAKAGDRHYRVFLNDPAGSQVINSTVIQDGTTTLVEGHNYTFLLWGYANPAGPGRPAGAPAMQLTILDESTIADPGANVALRVINATPTAIDVRKYAQGATPPVAADWAAIAPLTVSTVLTQAPDTVRFQVTPAGGGAVIADVRALVGCPANDGKSAVLPCQGIVGPIDALPGTTIAGSSVTLIVFPRTVPGTPAPQSTAAPSYQATQASFSWDRRPPRPPGV